MTDEELDELFIPACENILHEGRNKHNTLYTEALEFEDLLGVKCYTEWSNCFQAGGDFVPLSDQMRQLLIALAGPHGKTILRAYRIRKGLET